MRALSPQHSHGAQMSRIWAPLDTPFLGVLSCHGSLVVEHGAGLGGAHCSNQGSGGRFWCQQT